LRKLEIYDDFAFYRSASDFLNKTQKCLMLDEAANNLMLGLPFA